MQLMIAEKPSCQSDISSTLSDFDGLGLTNPPYLYKFNYENYTFLKNPIYRHNNRNFDYHWHKYSKGYVNKQEKFDFYQVTKKEFILFNEICFFLEADRSSIRGTDLFIGQFFKDDVKQYPITYCMLEDYKDINRGIREAYESRKFYSFEDSGNFNNPLNVIEKIEKFRHQYKIKDYIDYNFNAMINANGQTKTMMTRNAIITLLMLSHYKFRDQANAYNTIIKDMTDYSIGSSSSWLEIINLLIKEGFVSKTILKLTERGDRFLKGLHTPMQDFDKMIHFKRIEVLDNISYEDKIEAAKNHLSLMFGPCLNKH